MNPNVRVEGYDEVYRLDLEGATAFVAIHAIVGGRAFGGIRIRPYASERDALDDALALARAMSRKAAMAGLRGGGAKTVLIEPRGRRADAVRALGEFVQGLGGRYHCGADLGFTPEDHKVLAAATKYVACGGESAHTSRTVLAAMQALIRPRSAAIQGLGSVGRPLAAMLKEGGVRVVAADVRPVEGFESVPPDRILDQEADVFSPCAAGGVLDAAAVERLRCKVVCGAANNPFASDADAERLHRRGIAYVPDFIANSGALIAGASAALGESAKIEERIAAVGSIVRDVADRARREDRSPHFTAVAMADERIAAARLR